MWNLCDDGQNNREKLATRFWDNVGMVRRDQIQKKHFLAAAKMHNFSNISHSHHQDLRVDCEFRELNTNSSDH